MKYEYDLICIGLGPAGMAVSIMGSEMGLKVCSIERHKVGGECMNVGCIPSKSLLEMAAVRHVFKKLNVMELDDAPEPDVKNPFGRIRDYIKYINDKKTMGMFKKVDLILQKGDASFVNPHTIKVGGRRISAKRIFIAVGTRPMVPPISGIDKVDYLTNENLFDLDVVPGSMIILGGGAIGCEMAQAFSRLGCRCTIVHTDPYLIPAGEPSAGEVIERVFKEEGVEVYNASKLQRVEKKEGGIVVTLDDGTVLEGEKLLVAAGRKIDLSTLKLENAGVVVTERGALKVNKRLQTSQPHIYGVGDCNGHFLLTHAAMHQGMIALMNSMMPWPMKHDFKKFTVPWTVFTDPQVSHAGMTEKQIKEKGLWYEVVEERYENYGAAIAEDLGIGFVKAFISKTGKIYGVSIVGDGSGEMINEWALAIQKGIRIHDIMLLQHSFPTMGFLTKRVSETWMMNKMKSPTLKNMCRLFYRMGR